MKGVALRDRAAYLPDADALVVADLHVGRDEDSAVQFPLGERADLDGRLAALLAHFSPARVVVAGDVLHSFEGATAAARESLTELADTCRVAGAELVLVAGNHDVHLADVWDGEVHDAVQLGGAGGGDGESSTIVCHGHELPDVDGPTPDRYVCGHDHPTLAVEGQRHPCYLAGTAPDGADLLVLPAFNRLAPGVTVNRARTADFASPLVVDADALRPLVYDPDSQEVLEFPPLGECRSAL